MDKPPATAASLLVLAVAFAPAIARAASPPEAKALAASSRRPGGSAGKPAGNKQPGNKQAGNKQARNKQRARGKKAQRPAPAAAAAAPKAMDLSPFASERSAVKQAFADHLRDQVLDAERAARAPNQGKQDDRWNAVLYAIRDLDSRSSTEVCFWRAVAYYRLGELSRARRTRQQCELPQRDASTLDREDVASVSLQPPSALPELRMAGEVDHEEQRAIKPVANPNPYTGPPPTPPN